MLVLRDSKGTAEAEWGERKREGEEVRQQKEMGAVSFPTGILLQLLLEQDKAAPGASRGRATLQLYLN